MNNIFISLEDGSLLNLAHVVGVNKTYCVITTGGIFPISKTDFQRIKELVI